VTVPARTVIIILIAIILPATLAGGLLYLNRPQYVVVNAHIADDFPEHGFVHTDFESLLKEYVDSGGNVDYSRWQGSEGDRVRLGRYLAAVSLYSPDSAPARFAQRSDALAYWLYSYNAYVIYSVLAHWPIKSVTDVKAPIEAVKGLGFFYRQRFVFGGKAYSLYAIEHDKILAVYKDPRIHFVLNCASDSCPVLRPELPTGDKLERVLAASAADFVNDPRNVRIDHEQKQIVLSTIFKWYRNDFVGDLRRRGLPTERGVLDYLAVTASTALRADIDAASGYELIFEDYNWALNSRDAVIH
jgi:hypothetical protein